jgi:phage shock protein C
MFYGSPNPHRLYRDTSRGWLAGVCAGVADYLGIETMLVRLAMVPALIFFFVPTLIGYIVLAVALPARPSGLYQSGDDEAFWRGVATRPQSTLAALRQRFRDLESRLQRMESTVTAQDFELRRKFRDIGG